MRYKPDFKGSWWYFVLLATIVPLDQLTKLWVRTNLFLGESRPPEGFFRISYFQNTGASFGMFPEAAGFFTVFSTVSFILMMSAMLFLRPHLEILDTTLGKLGLGLLSAGTLGNLIDRYNLGYVVDFIDFSFWPAFNVADSAIVVGAIILAACILIYSNKIDGARDGGQS